MFINERKRNANTYLISNFDSIEAAPFKSTALGSCLVCLGLNSPLRQGPVQLNEGDGGPQNWRFVAGR